MALASIELAELSGMAAVAAIRSKHLSAEELVTAFVDRIESENQNTGAFRQVLSDEALTQARILDARIARGDTIGALAGLPIGIKENCDTAGVACSAGLNFRKDYVPVTDSLVTKRLRRADAIVVGITVSDPGAFDVRTPEVVHPLNPDLTVGGSSGGSAAALAAGMCLGAIGTDTGGSIRIPSACCGTVGLKPTFGTLSMEGIFPLVPSLDHVGPMARTVADTALLWESLSVRANNSASESQTVGFDPSHFNESDDKVRSDLEAVLEIVKGMGMKCVEVALPTLDEVVEMHGRIFIVESAIYHLSNHAEHLKSYPRIAQEWFAAARSLSVDSYIDSQKLRVELTKQLDRLLQEVDLLLTPTIAVSTPPRDVTEISVGGEMRDFTMGLVRHTCLFDHTGHPALATPANTHDDLIPTGIQIIGKHGCESEVLDFGGRLEAHFARPP